MMCISGSKGALMLPLAFAACADQPPPTVDIKAVNYAFVTPAALPAGPTVFRFVNDGTVPHEVQFFRFRRGIGADSGRALLAAEHFPDSLADSSGVVMIAGPHDSPRQRVLVDLQPGEVYALVCEFRDSTNAPKHNRLGMFGVIQVTAPR